MTGTRKSASLETPRLSLRRFSRHDAALMLAIWNDPGFIRHVCDRGIRTLEQASDALDDGILAMYRELGFGPYRVVRRSDDTPMGICGLFQREYLDDPDLGFAFLPAYCRRGYAEEASRAVLEEARVVMGLERVSAIVSPGNAKSINLIEKLGFSLLDRRVPPGEDSEILLYEIELD